MKTRIKKYIIAIMVAFAFVLACITPFGAGAVAYAADDSLNYDNTDVMDDLQGSTIGGKVFDVNDYAFNPFLSTSVLYLAEYCYSPYAGLQGNYNLYLYVWNPQRLNFVDSSQNFVEFSYGGVNETEYVKKPLKLLSVSTQTNYEGLFYKFRIALTASDKTEMLRTLDSSERVYHIVGMELVRKDTGLKDYKVNKVYSYKGFAEGYGPNSKENTLTYTSTFGDVLDIERQGGLHQTFFRPKVDDSIDGTTQDTLQSVYFSIPNEYFENDFRLSSVRMEWLKVQTAYGLITGNETVYNELLPWVGVNSYGEYANGDKSQSYRNDNGGSLPTPYAFTSEVASFNYSDKDMPYLAYLFPTDDFSTDSADDYVVSWESILKWMQTYHDEYDVEDKTYYDSEYVPVHVIGQPYEKGMDVNYSRPYDGELLTVDSVTYDYSRALFMHVAPHKALTDITADMEYSLISRKVDKSWWTMLWNDGNPVTSYTTRFDGIEAIHPVTKADFKSTITATCESLFVDRSDYAEFKAFYDLATLKGETVVLVRYDVGKYVAAEATEGLPTSTITGARYIKGDTNARVFSMSAYLGLDVIHLELDNGEEVFILPCVSTPIDAGSDSTKAGGTHSDKNKGLLDLPLAVLALVLLVLLLWPILPFIIQGIVWVILLSFCLIKAIVKAFKKKE